MKLKKNIPFIYLFVGTLFLPQPSLPEKKRLKLQLLLIVIKDQVAKNLITLIVNLN